MSDPKRIKLDNIEESKKIFETLYESDFVGTKQTIKCRDDEVKNSAKGYVFKVSDLTRIRRFLILGTSGGTYYSTEKQLTIENLNDLVKIIKNGKGAVLLREILDISLAGRAPKQEPTMFALALCARFDVEDRGTKLKKNRKGQPLTEKEEKEICYDDYILQLNKAAFHAVSKVCRIPTHLFMFVKYCEMVSSAFRLGCPTSGWGRMMRAAISSWYLDKDPKSLVLHITKYKQREGWSHADLLKLCHPNVSKKDDDALIYDQIFYYVIHGKTNPKKRQLPSQDLSEAPATKKLRHNYTVTKAMIEKEETSDALKFLHAAIILRYTSAIYQENTVAQLIHEYGLVREHIVNTQLLNSEVVWKALLENMPMTALIRNLPKLSQFKFMSHGEYLDKVVANIQDAKRLKEARIHPLSVLLALTTYKQGSGIKGKHVWSVKQDIVKALEKAFLLCFQNVEPTGKRFCLAYDVSGSMADKIMGTHLSCREASVALGMCLLRTEPEVQCMAFSERFEKLPFTKDWNLMAMVEHVQRMEFSSTDCAQPMIWAAKTRKLFDAFIVFTDNETYFGKIKPFQALAKYRNAMNIPDAKLIVVGLTATNFTIADPTDPGMLDVVGFDAAVPELIRNCVLGEI